MSIDNVTKIAIYFVLSVALTSLASCSSKDKKQREVVAEWQGKDFIFPDVMRDVLTGDTINTDDADFTIVTYIDSAGCTSCAMKLPLWKFFLNSLDSICQDVDYNSIIVVNSRDEKELSYLIQSESYEYPVVCDAEDSLNKMNKLPENTMFRTFLLDRNKRVLAIGNPVFNPGIAELYKSIISGSKIFSSSGKQMVFVDKQKIEIGEIRLGEDCAATVVLTNVGSDPVRIREVISSCRCTNISLPDSLIISNGTLPVEITFRADSVLGEFQRSIHIFYNGFENPTMLEISGIVTK